MVVAILLSFTPFPLFATSELYFLHNRVPISSSLRRKIQWRKDALGHVVFPQAAALSRTAQGSFDPELRLVLELATDSELYEIESILFSPSYFSPLLKSITNKADVGIMHEVDYEGREDFIRHLESRFLFLAADARSTLRGWRPSYRNVLLDVRRKLSIPCTSKLSTEDLEAEIFLHLLQEHSSEESGSTPSLLDKFAVSDGQSGSEVGLGQWKMRALSVLKVGAEELQSMILKLASFLFFYRLESPVNRHVHRNDINLNEGLAGVNFWSKRMGEPHFIGWRPITSCYQHRFLLTELRELLACKGGGMFALAKIYELLARRLSGKMLSEAANYQIKREIIKKGGQLAAINLESRMALFAARKGFASAASRYLGLRSMMMLLGVMLWGTFLADVVIQMIGTDYARILRAIYAFAQIRLTRTYGWTSSKDQVSKYL